MNKNKVNITQGIYGVHADTAICEDLLGALKYKFSYLPICQI